MERGTFANLYGFSFDLCLTFEGQKVENQNKGEDDFAAKTKSGQRGGTCTLLSHNCPLKYMVTIFPPHINSIVLLYDKLALFFFLSLKINRRRAHL